MHTWYTLQQRIQLGTSGSTCNPSWKLLKKRGVITYLSAMLCNHEHPARTHVCRAFYALPVQANLCSLSSSACPAQSRGCSATEWATSHHVCAMMRKQRITIVAVCAVLEMGWCTLEKMWAPSATFNISCFIRWFLLKILIICYSFARYKDDNE